MFKSQLHVGSPGPNLSVPWTTAIKLQDMIGFCQCIWEPNIPHLFPQLVVMNSIELCGKLWKSTQHFLPQNRYYTSSPSGQIRLVDRGFNSLRQNRTGRGLTSGGVFYVPLDSCSYATNGTQIITDSCLRVVNTALGDRTLSFICPVHIEFICISMPPKADTCLF